MPFLSRQEIKENALKFAKEWEEAQYEKGESQTFWNEFFAVFGVKRRNVAAFEERVKNLIGQTKFIDLFWPEKLLAEHKSRGADLGKAQSQAYQYVCNLIDQGRSEEVPRYIIVSDFARIVLHDLEPGEGDELVLEFPLGDLHKYIDTFYFISGYQPRNQPLQSKPDELANIRASELMGEVHDALFESGYIGHDLERFLVRVLFCLFAEDTRIFGPGDFTWYIENFTHEDGSDLGVRLGAFFDILDTPKENRQKNLDALLENLEYIDGGLFRETLRPPTCNRNIREVLLNATRFDWSKISPAVFGSLFQSVMNKDARRKFGAHYTTEENILKLIRPLFLDALRAEFIKIKSNKGKLQAFHQKLASLTFFDPACGCGNFLVISYRELRELEMEVFEALHRNKQQLLDASFFSQVDVDQFYGIEIVEFPAQIAETALWLMDHQMNLKATDKFGKPYVRLPLKKSATIVHGNALRIDWNDVLPKENCSYILGNPPFVGKQYQSPIQKEDVRLTLSKIDRFGVLDYVSCWYYKATEYIQGTNISVGFVSTNSITQGEQVGILWSVLFAKGIHIRFAYRTFVWSSEARGKAHVHCVIVGFGLDSTASKTLYEQVGTNLTVHKANQINRYLVDAPDVVVLSRNTPLSDNVPQMAIGNQPIDGGNYLFTAGERKEFLKIEPGAAPYFRKWFGAEEFLNGPPRWFLWLGECPPELLRKMPECLKRIEAVRQFRLGSKRKSTLLLAKSPLRFQVENIPTKQYMVIPEVSSERREYIPIGFLPVKTMASNRLKVIQNSRLWHFGILSSQMHMAWVGRVCGRLESRYLYSVHLVYNNFPWPENITATQIERIEEKAKQILEVRKEHPNSSLADLYDPLTMPNDLRKAHRELDKAVDRAYRAKPFANDTDRLAFLFNLYEKFIRRD